MEFIYKEFESEANLFDKLLPGVSNIYKFLCALNQKIGDNSKLFHDIMNKVGKLNILKVNRTDLFGSNRNCGAYVKLSRMEC